MYPKNLVERGLEVAAEALRPVEEVRRAGQSLSVADRASQATIDGMTAHDRIQAFVLAQGLGDLDTQDINAFDNRAHAVMLTYPERYHEVVATQSLVGELETSRAVIVGHQLLDIIVER